MTWVAVAVGGGAIVGGLISSHGATSAADTQAGAANHAADISQNEFNTITAQEQPFMQSGYGAQNQLNYLLGIGAPPGQAGATGSPNSGIYTGGGLGGNSASGPGDRMSVGSSGAYGYHGPGGMQVSPTGQSIPASAASGPTNSGSSPAGGYGSLLTPFTAQNFRDLSPAYQFQLQQGQQGVLNADASGQGALSGAAMKDLIGYNQGMADTSFNNAFNQYQTQQGNIYSRLSGIANLGQNAASNTGQQGANLAGQVAQSVTNAGSAQAAGQVGAANAWSGALGNLSSLPFLMQGGGGAGYGGGGGDAAAQAAAGQGFSDRRLKKDVRKVGKDTNDLSLYRFKYIWQDEGEPATLGYMADEVMRKFPSAVKATDEGYLKVNYREVPASA